MVFSPATASQLFALTPVDKIDMAHLSETEHTRLGTMQLGFERGSRRVRGYRAQNVARWGAIRGFLTKPARPFVISVFVTKGGVLKTSLTLNLARMAALHGIRTCVIGLDMQCDVTAALTENSESQTTDFETQISEQEGTAGLFEAFRGKKTPFELIVPTSLPTLSMIPETPELVVLEKMLFQKARRESWLLDTIVRPLKSHFDLIVLDSSPNWNLLTTNALVACDVLLSPLECKVNNYRNFKMFENFMEEFRQELGLSFRHIFVPTKLNSQRRLSREIFAWYLENVKNIVPIPLRESALGEEAIASNLSTPEYAPGSAAALEMNQILSTFWQMTLKEAEEKNPGNNLAELGL